MAFDKNKTFTFVYRFDEDDDSLEEGLVGTERHIVGRELASVDDLFKEISQYKEDAEYEAWGYKNYVIVKEGIYTYDRINANQWTYIKK